MRQVIVIAAIVLVLVGTAIKAAPDEQFNAFQLFLLATRTDMELLANEAWGVGVRIDTWTFNSDLQSITMVADLWYDNEQLATAIFGSGVRPPLPPGVLPLLGAGGLPEGNWFGATSSDYVLIARNVRHDLELSADAFWGVGNRPDAWIGALNIYQCDRTLQNVTRLLDVFYSARSVTMESVLDYCGTLRSEVIEELLPVMYNTVEPGSAEEDIIAQIAAIRGDLERLANELLGVSNRPTGWSGSLDETSPTFALEVDVDMSLLADNVPEDQNGDGLPNPAVIGLGLRPEGWIGFIPSSLTVSQRNMRNNLELLADVTLGDGVRPHGWQGVDPMLQCNLLEQGFATILTRRYGFVVDATLAGSPDFCAQMMAAANQLAENPPIPSEEEEESIYIAQSEYAFAYLDPAALLYMGMMPGGTEFRAWYRNYGESTMMFVTGQNFGVYIDRRWTTMDTNIFNSLPSLEGVQPLAFCDAEWCSGPGPTPTPTGGGPLIAVIINATPAATVDTGEGAAKTQVSWNHIRVTYLLDRPETGTVQVALEICAEPEQINCEPVINVYDSALGAPKPVLSQFNGLNVYEFRYGYNSNVAIEGTTLIAPDIWISDPTLR